MRQTRLMLTIAALLTLGFVSFAAAQMMGNKKDNPSMGKADSTSQPGMMGTGMVAQMDTAMGNMSQHCKIMSSDFEKFQNHFEQMMLMTDQETLKIEMKKHHDMMKNMRESMMQQQSMCQNMKSTMHSGGMRGTMGKDDKRSDSSGQDSHDH